jgi:hypothetical protein
MPAWLILGTRQKSRRYCVSGWEETKENAVRNRKTSVEAVLNRSRYRLKIKQDVWSLLSRVPPDPFDANNAQNGYLTPL